jgi:hypothetical protein
MARSCLEHATARKAANRMEVILSMVKREFVCGYDDKEKSETQLSNVALS